jgi:hypothetical protein
MTEKEIPRGTISAEDVKLAVEGMLKAAYDKVMTRPEAAEPRYWWNVFGFGPIQPGAHDPHVGGFAGPLLPHQIIRQNETAYVASLIILNPFVPPGSVPPTPSELLQTFALPYEVTFQMSNLTTWASAGTLNAAGAFVPGGPGFYVNIVEIPTAVTGLYEMNIVARILGAGGNPAPPFAGFARAVFDIDDELFLPAPGMQYDFPIRYQIYA